MDAFARRPEFRFVATLLLPVALAACRSEPPDTRAKNVQVSTASQVTLVSRAGRLRNFPCSQCHKEVDAAALKGPDGERKHDDIQLEHIELPCLTCHTADNMDRLHTLQGKSLSFDDVQEVCGQCHADKLADWKIGAHGKTIGGWAKARQRYTCTECHNPHSPRIAPVQALPGPPFPKLGIPKGAAKHD